MKNQFAHETCRLIHQSLKGYWQSDTGYHNLPFDGTHTHTHTCSKSNSLIYQTCLFYIPSLVIKNNQIAPTSFSPPTPPTQHEGQGLLIIEASRSHSDTIHSARLLWTSDQPDAETSTWHNTHNRQKRPCNTFSEYMHIFEFILGFAYVKWMHNMRSCPYIHKRFSRNYSADFFKYDTRFVNWNL
jgi:hypothetical protein